MPSSSSDSAETSHSLIWKLQRRDEAAWQRMVDLYTPLIHYWCHRSGLNVDEASDVTQEVFRSAAQSIDQFHPDPQRGTFRGWLRTIFKTRLVDFIRRQSLEPHARGGTDALRWMENAPAEADEPLDAATQALFQRVLDLIRGEFSEQAWQAFWMTVVENCSSRDVSARLNMTSGAVRQAKYRILRRVREELGDVP